MQSVRAGMQSVKVRGTPIMHHGRGEVVEAHRYLLSGGGLQEFGSGIEAFFCLWVGAGQLLC